jgi:NAD(P)-dependent dehydrogenase (short-subunit alcohol dehydrogenase family)
MKKNILITGSSGNLGKASVEKFVKEGYRVIATVSPGKKLEFDVAGEVHVIEVDLTDEKNTELVVADIIATYKSIDVGLFLVGGFNSGSIKVTDGSQLRKMYSLNFETAYFAIRPIFSQMLNQQQGGRLIVVGARPALGHGGKDVLAYALSKSLLFRLAEYLNAEGAEKNVVTSVVVPGIIDTPANRHAMPDSVFSNWVTPEAIAEAMHFIASAQGSALREPVIKLYGNS